MQTLCRLLVTALLLGSAASSQELLTRQVNLAEMTQAAGLITRGEVTAVRVESHPDYPNIATVKVTVRVMETIYGRAGRQLTFRSYLPGNKFAKRAPKTGGLGYRVGEELVLFLYPEGRYGLTSPVGGEQGRFRVERRGSRRFAMNSVLNRGLFESVSTQARAKGVQFTSEETTAMKQAAGPVDVEVFLRIIRRLAAQKEPR